MIKSVKDMERNENCPSCGEFAERKFMPSRLHITGAKVEHAEYNPGLGCVVKSKRHREELCKRKGLVEIGNDFKSPEKMQKKFDHERAAKRRRSWEEV